MRWRKVSPPPCALTIRMIRKRLSCKSLSRKKARAAFFKTFAVFSRMNRCMASCSESSINKMNPRRGTRVFSCVIMRGKGGCVMNQKLLPHRFPFLLIDGTTNSEAGKWAAAYKNISENDWFITESQREMPFSLVVEAMAQTAACAGITDGDGLGLLSAVKKAERLGAALPGDRLDLF